MKKTAEGLLRNDGELFRLFFLAGNKLSMAKECVDKGLVGLHFP